MVPGCALSKCSQECLRVKKIREIEFVLRKTGPRRDSSKPTLMNLGGFVYYHLDVLHRVLRTLPHILPAGRRHGMVTCTNFFVQGVPCFLLLRTFSYFVHTASFTCFQIYLVYWSFFNYGLILLSSCISEGSCNYL